MNRYLAIGCLAVAGLATGLAPERRSALDPSGAAAAELRVLFVGNSYTFVNDLPGMFAQLASAGGHEAAVDSAVGPGWTLAQHASAPETLAKIRGTKWDFVVLQEQSQIPASPPARSVGMYPAARALAAVIGESGARCVFFVTWARRDGWPEAGLPSFESMQVAINQGYLQIARELKAKAAPAGPAWARAQESAPGIALWQADGSHPTPEGTYLTACVFYCTLFRETPVGVEFTAGLPPTTARRLQEIAAASALPKVSMTQSP